MSYDGGDVATTKLGGSVASAKKTDLGLGVLRTAPSIPYDVRYDNVVLDVE